MRKLLFITIILFLFPLKVYGKLNYVGLSCVSPDYPNNLNENSLVLMTYWFKPNSQVLESFVLKNETGVIIQKFISSYYYHEEISFLKWGTIVKKKINRKTLELSYIGIEGKTWKRKCSIFNTEKEMDKILNEYYENTKTIINQIKKDNKI